MGFSLIHRLIEHGRHLKRQQYGHGDLNQTEQGGNAIFLAGGVAEVFE